MPKIFLSYRRQDSAAMAGRIYDRLRLRFGNDAVFMDIDSIPFGEDFRKHIDAAVGQADLVLAVIGPRWMGRTLFWRRIDNTKDFVRIELESAIRRGLPVIPVLIDRTRMPTEAELPPTLAELTYRNAIDVDQGRDFHHHVDRLVQGIEFHFERAKSGAGRSSSQPRESDPTSPVANEPERRLSAAGETKSASSTTKVPSPKPAPPQLRREPSPPQPRREWTNSIGMKLVRIEAGEFLMGTTKDQVDQLKRLFPDSKQEWFDAEQPQHSVKISRPFFLGIYEVTQGQYQAVLGNNPSKFKGSDDLPVENVSWLDAVGFCNKLSKREKRTPFYRIDGTGVTLVGGNGYRLPTEAEWEYACRAKSTTLYPFGDEASKLDEHAWSSSNAESKTHPVGQKLPNAWGLYDMLGNVWEWCADAYDKKYYVSPPPANPPGAVEASRRVFRGGGWHGNPWYCRPADRSWRVPGSRDSSLGFRVAAVQE